MPDTVLGTVDTAVNTILKLFSLCTIRGYLFKEVQGSVGGAEKVL